jgi:hypothetical protein
MHLTDTAIRNACLSPRPRKIYDGNGLYTLLAPSRPRTWYFRSAFSAERRSTFGPAAVPKTH